MSARRKLVLGLVAVAALLLVATQLILPDLAEREIENRLTEHGGSASAEVSSLPAVRLLFTDGERIEVSGRDLTFDLEAEDRDALEKLDGFGEVEIVLDDVLAGPFEVHSFSLTRDGGERYRLRLVARITSSSVAAFGASRIGGGSLAAGLGAALLDGAVSDRLSKVPVRMSLELVSDEGSVDVTGGNATVEGFDVTPIAAFITTMIVSRI